MHRPIMLATMMAVVLSAGCSEGADEAAGTDPAAAAAEADSLELALREEALRMQDAARNTLAQLLSNPASATFDSLAVVRTPGVEGRPPTMAACGLIGGSPGIGGRTTPARFIYQSRITVFVEDDNNGEQFTSLWDRICAGSNSELLSGGEGGPA